jgi:hypothetical protein
MEPEGSLPHLQEISTVPILNQTNSVYTTPSYLSKIYINIIYPPTSWSSRYCDYAVRFYSFTADRNRMYILYFGIPFTVTGTTLTQNSTKSFIIVICTEWHSLITTLCFKHKLEEVRLK